MGKIMLIAKTNVLRHKGAAAALFIIAAILSALATISLSVLLEAEKDYIAGIDRLNSMHGMIIMPLEKYKASFEDILANDPRITQYEIKEVLFVDNSTLDYGGKVDLSIIIGNMDEQIAISPPFVIESDGAIPSADAVYLPALTKNYGYKTGDPFVFEYRNMDISLIVAGFFETAELSLPNAGTIKIYAPGDSYERLSLYAGRSAQLTARFYDMWDAIPFNMEFLDKTDLEITSFFGDVFTGDIGQIKEGSLYPIYIVTSIILLFAGILILISLLVIRFRVTNSIESSLHEIGVLKAQGYTNRQISACYTLEYCAVSAPAAAFGTLASVPVFGILRGQFGLMTGFPWTFGANPAAAAVSVIAVLAVFILTALQSASRVKTYPPVSALRGGTATNNYKRGFISLKKFPGNVHFGLGIKNVFAYFRLYAMIGLVVAGVSLAVTFIAALYQNFITDQTTLFKMAGVEASDVTVTVTRHTDAAALAAEMEQLPEVRKTSMMDITAFTVDGHNAMFAYISDDFTRCETISALEGRMPIYDNEVAIPMEFAARLGKKIGDGVKIKSNGISQEYIITGHYSTLINNGTTAMISLEGYRRLNPNYKRNSINVYLGDGVAYDAFSEILKRDYGVLNVYRGVADAKYEAAKARAEEKISFYMEHYNIDSVEYAVIYKGDIILSGSSREYQIEKITDYGEFLSASIGTYSVMIPMIAQAIIAVSLVIVTLILMMTVRAIVAKRRRELGMLKAAGYTARQLAGQMAISFMPMTAAGVVAGCAGGALSIGPMMGGMLSFAGAQSAAFGINPSVVIALGAVTLAVTCAVAYVSSLRIRRISVYELLTE